MTVTPLGRDQDCSLKNRELDVPVPWFLDPKVGARPQRLDCTSSSLESCPLYPVHSVEKNFLIYDGWSGIDQEGKRKMYLVYQLFKHSEPPLGD
ncbi:hypothetical protein STEG23_013963 [Scotinomys teguina]